MRVDRSHRPPIRGVKAEWLFVFAGAGASFVPPAELPLFVELRDHVLSELGLDAYAPSSSVAAPTPERLIAEGLVPEPFMLALQNAGVPVASWLSDVFAGATPNGVHVVLAQLAAGGANVWTVNFDDAIERAAPSPLRVLAWPDSPKGPADLLKPHGTAGGRLIVTAEQVLSGLDPPWLDRLRDDVQDRIAIFIGYRGRDLDFQPVWDEVLQTAHRVIWFDFPPVDARSDAERAHKRRLLRQVDASGRLEFPDPAPPPAAGIPPNPSWDFVVWSEANGLAAVPADLRRQIHERRDAPPLPPIGPTGPIRTAAVQELLGDIAGARATYVRVAVRGPDRTTGARRLAGLTSNHGGRRVATALTTAAVIPPVGRLRRIRDGLLRKRLSIHFNVGNHGVVIRNTSKLPDDAVSTLRVLRAGSLRMTGDVDDAAGEAERAFHQAVLEHHPVRAANAAFQHVFALMWGGRLDEAESALGDELRPHAELAATRWVAWADFLDAALHIHRSQPDQALALIEAGTTRFQGEALEDGVISCGLVRLTALRQAGDRDRFYVARTELAQRLATPSGTYYARRSRFTAEAVALEDGEFARCHRSDLDAARQSFRSAAASRHSVHQALGLVGLAAVELEKDNPGTAGNSARRAAEIARGIHARLVLERAVALDVAASKGIRSQPPEVFFP
jgi:hypothetical protein